MGGQPVEIKRRKALALFCYLAVTGKIHSREKLATFFWPEHDERRAAAYLRQALWTLKKTDAGVWLKVDRDSVGTDENKNLWLDVEIFRRLVADSRTHPHADAQTCGDCFERMKQAVEIYQDHFMAGFTLRDSPEFDRWQFVETEKLQRDLVNTLDRLVQNLTLRHEFERAIPYARRWQELDGLDETAHRQLIKLYFWTGQRSAALHQYELCVHILDEELSIEPLQETQALFESVLADEDLPVPDHSLQVAPTASEMVTRPLRDRSAGKAHSMGEADASRMIMSAGLPGQPTPFIGREHELSTIEELFANPDCRLLTLVGPGGAGKTRLAIQYATSLNGAMAGSVSFVNLAPLDEPGFLVPAIAEALDVTFFGQEDPKELLLNYLREKQLLLVMDNFEHLLDGASLAAEMLTEAPGLRVLTTSRQRLSIRGEWVVEVRGLEFPEENLIEQADHYDALELLQESARRIQPNFRLTESDRPGAVRICQLVDGLPLAIELAVAWIRMMSLEEIADEIAKCYQFLSGSLQDLPKRHQSLWAVFEHSWRLLTNTEKQVFGQLSVFRGGFDRDAANAVVGAGPQDLLALMEKSLLRRMDDQRFEFHELLRQYAEEKLAADTEAHDAVHQAHSRHFGEFVHSRLDRLRGEDQQLVSAEISQDFENIRRGWRWAVSAEQLDIIEQYLDGLYIYFELRGRMREGDETFGLGRALRHGNLKEVLSGNRAEEIHARLAARQGGYKIWLGEYGQAADLLENSLDLFRTRGQESEVAFCLNHIGNLARLRGDYPRAKTTLEEGIAISKKTGESRRLARALNMLGIVTATQGEFSEATKLFRASVSRLREIGDAWGIAKAVNNLGIVTYYLEQYGEAEQLYQESIRLNQDIGDLHGIAISLNNLGLISHRQGQFREALVLHQESLDIFREIGYQMGAGLCLNDLGKASIEIGETGQARKYFYEALETFQAIQSEPMLLSVLIGLAKLQIQDEQHEKALRLSSMVIGHASSDQESRTEAEHLIAEIERQIPKNNFEAAQNRLHGSDLEVLVRDLLADRPLGS